MRERPLLSFAVLSAAAVAIGAASPALSGAAPGSWLRNPIAWCVGALIAGGLARTRLSTRAAVAVPLAAGAALASTFLFDPADGVHRWIDLGPLQINAAGLVLPASIVALSAVRSSLTLLLIAVATTALLAAQPDASQASAFAAAASLLLLSRPQAHGLRYGGVAVLAAVTVVSWLRPDPLKPVPEVEGIFDLAFSAHPLLAVAAAIALALTCLAPLGLLQRRGAIEPAAAALTAYFGITALAPLAGAFPVPLVGLGMSFPVGFWIGFGLLAATRRAGQPASTGG